MSPPGRRTPVEGMAPVRMTPESIEDSVPMPMKPSPSTATRVTDVERRVRGIEDRTLNLGVRLEHVEEQCDQITTDLRTVHLQVAQIAIKLDTLAGSFDRVDKLYERLERREENHQERLSKRGIAVLTVFSTLGAALIGGLVTVLITVLK